MSRHNLPPEEKRKFSDDARELKLQDVSNYCDQVCRWCIRDSIKTQADCSYSWFYYIILLQIAKSILISITTVI